GRVELHELLLERTRKATTAQIPAVELLQKAACTLFTELADRLADEQGQLRGDFLTRGLRTVAVDDLPQSPRIALRAAPDHHACCTGQRKHALRPGARRDVTGCNYRDVDELHQLSRQRVIGLAGVHLPRASRMQGEGCSTRSHEADRDVEARARAILEPAAHLDRSEEHTSELQSPYDLV